jgi:phenylpropionate dioxygenase-like ring-hydroxylating dioxygenase large terminal subunit
VAANYKVLLENYNECYHCGPVHPELSRLVPAFAGGGGDLDWDAGIPHRDGAWTFTTTGTTARQPLPGLSDTERERHKQSDTQCHHKCSRKIPASQRIIQSDQRQRQKSAQVKYNRPGARSPWKEAFEKDPERKKHSKSRHKLPP